MAGEERRVRVAKVRGKSGFAGCRVIALFNLFFTSVPDLRQDDDVKLRHCVIACQSSSGNLLPYFQVDCAKVSYRNPDDTTYYVFHKYLFAAEFSLLLHPPPAAGIILPCQWRQPSFTCCRIPHKCVQAGYS